MSRMSFLSHLFKGTCDCEFIGMPSLSHLVSELRQDFQKRHETQPLLVLAVRRFVLEDAVSNDWRDIVSSRCMVFISV